MILKHLLRILTAADYQSGRGLSQMTNQQYKHGGGNKGIFPQERLAYSYERINNSGTIGREKTAKCCFPTRSGEQAMVVMEISEEKLFPTINPSNLILLRLKNCSSLCCNICANMIRNHDTNIYHVYRDLNIQVLSVCKHPEYDQSRILKSMLNTDTHFTTVTSGSHELL